MNIRRTYGRKSRKSPLVYVAAGVVALFIASFAFVSCQSYYEETTHTNCVIDSKDRTRNEDGSSDARVYTKNCGTFVVADTLVKGNFSSGDLYGSLSEGSTYDLTSYGFRSGFFSQFPNIIEAREVSP